MLVYLSTLYFMEELLLLPIISVPIKSIRMGRDNGRLAHLAAFGDGAHAVSPMFMFSAQFFLATALKMP